MTNNLETVIMHSNWLTPTTQTGLTGRQLTNKIKSDQAFTYDGLKRKSWHMCNRYMFDNPSKYVMFPVNHHGNHWVVVCVNLKQNQLLFYDPFKKQHELFEHYKDAVMRIVKLAADDNYYPVEKRKELNAFISSHTVIDNPEWSLKQEDGTAECGPLCMLFMLQTAMPDVLHRQRAGSLSYSHAKQLRSTLLNLIYRGLLDNLFDIPNICSSS